MEIYVFDGSLEGLLTLIFDWYSRKPAAIQVVSSAHYQPHAFSTAYQVVSETEKATRVYTGLRKRLSKAGWRSFYCTFLSEDPEAYQHLFHFAVYAFTHGVMIEENFGDEHVLFVTQMTRKVEREKHHLEAFVRFQQTQDGVFYAPVEPKYNVLPLLATHFQNRYADQQWIIYDHQRKYGLYYDLHTLEIITMDFQTHQSGTIAAPHVVETHEEVYQLLWKGYFNSANIPARKNLKLQVRSMPRRFWRYLTEKQPDL